jgi:hypothetical protein
MVSHEISSRSGAAVGRFSFSISRPICSQAETSVGLRFIGQSSHKVAHSLRVRGTVPAFGARGEPSPMGRAMFTIIGAMAELDHR